MRQTISSHRDNDDMRHFFFERDSKLPHGTFGSRKWTPDRFVVVACVVLAVLLVIWTRTG